MKPMSFVTEGAPRRQQSLEHSKRQRRSRLRAAVETALLPPSWDRAVMYTQIRS